jgi:hypothetical protein
VSAAAGPSRSLRHCSWSGFALGAIYLAIGAASAHAAPVTIDFESGATPNQPVTNQYGPPGTPAGPTFLKGEEAGFKQLGCGPPRLVAEGTAHSGSRSLLLNGCPGGEFWPTATFFSLGYSTQAVEFWLAVQGTLSYNVTVITTAFDAERKIVQQEETILPPQSSTTYKQVAVTSGTGNIAYVAVEEGTKGTNTNTATGVGLTVGNSYLSLDDLTYDPPSSPPESSFLLGSNPSVANVVPGGESELSIPISWTNNPNPSASPVLLELSAPSGITGSFSPNPTSSGSSTLKLKVAKSAATGTGTLEVTGYVDKGLVSEKTSSISIPLYVSPAFEIVNPGAVTLAPCTRRDVTLRVNTPYEFSEPLDLSVTTVNAQGAEITGISGGQVTDPSHATTTVVPQKGSATATLTLVGKAGAHPASPVAWGLTASAPGYASQFTTGTLAIEAGAIDKVVTTGTSFTPSSVSTPAVGVLGSPLTLKGAGFCPGSKLAIGDPDNPATAESISSDGTSASFRVPRGAITGPIHVLPPTGQQFDGPTLSVRSFRNTYGFSWVNGDYGLRLDGDMVDELFGTDETNINVFGWLVRKPEASLFEYITNKFIPKGICFGIAFSSEQFRDFPGELSRFPRTGEADAWHLDAPSAPSPALLRFVTERFSLQFTDQVIPIIAGQLTGQAINAHPGNEDLSTIEAELSKGRPVMIGLLSFSPFGGHTVLAYDTEQLPDGKTAVYVANSNAPYRTSEEENPSAHDQAEFTNSRIVIDQSGHWSFDEQGWSGPDANLFVFKHDQLPILNGQRPKLPNVFTASAIATAVAIAFGSSGDSVTQVSDGQGALFQHGAIAAAGSWPKGVAPIPALTGGPAPLQLVSINPKIGRAITATVKRSAGGGDMSLNLPGLQATLSAGSKAGQIDHVSVDPRSDSIGYRTSAAHTRLGGTLLSSPDAGASAGAPNELSDRLVRFETSGGSGGEDRIAFPSGHSFVLRHSGAAAKLAATLSAFDARGRPIALKLPKLSVGRGERLRITAENWSKLGSSPVRVQATVRGRTTVRRVRGRTIGRRFATARRASLVASGGGRYRVDLRLRVRRAPKGAWLSVAGTLLRRGHRIERTAPTQLDGATLRGGKTYLTLPKKLRPGSYSLQVRLLETTAQGAIQGSRTVTRGFRVRVPKP